MRICIYMQNFFHVYETEFKFFRNLNQYEFVFNNERHVFRVSKGQLRRRLIM